jgi:hypothetical protein
MHDLLSHKIQTMVKNIQNFDKVYGEQIYPADGMVYTIEKASVIKTYSEPELLYYFEVKLLDMYNTHRPGKYQIAIFADHKEQHNIAAVYKTGQQASLFMDKFMSSVHFKNKEFFKTYVVTLINQALK